MRSRSRPCRRPTLRQLRWPRRLRWFRQRKSIPTLASVANGKRNITRRQRPIMTPAGIRTRRAISGPRRTKSSSPAKDPTGAPRWRVFCCLCATTTGPPAISRSAPLSGFVRSGSRQRGNSTFRAFAAALAHFREPLPGSSRSFYLLSRETGGIALER
jgi:hypothetical protein